MLHLASSRVRGAVNLLLPHNPGYLPIAGYCLTPISAAKIRVEASTLSVACTIELGTSGKVLVEWGKCPLIRSSSRSALGLITTLQLEKC